MFIPIDIVKRAAPRRLKRAKPQPIPWVLIDELFHRNQAKKRPPGVVCVPSGPPAPSVILFVSMLMSLPVIHEQLVALLGKLKSHLILPITVQPLVDEVICWPPYIASPVILILEGGIRP